MHTELPWFLENPRPEIFDDPSTKYVVVDFETTVLQKGSPLNEDNRIVLAVWDCSWKEETYQFGGEYDLDALVADCNEADFIVAHNAKFELQWLARCGLELENVLVFDTMVAEYVLGGNRWQFHALSLEACGQRRLNEGKVGIISKMYKANLCSTEIPESWLLHYCRQDVHLTHRLFKAQLEAIKEEDLWNVVWTRMLTIPILADIETNGMVLDPHLVRTRFAAVQTEALNLERDLNRITGGINVNSTKQLAEFLYDTMGFNEVRKRVGRDWIPDRTAKGKPKTDAATIAQLKATTAEQREFLEKFKRSKELYNELTKYLTKFDACCDESGGLLKAQFNQTNTKTHRLSSTGLEYTAQFQNFPRAYKPMFMARRDGWLVGEGDGSQLEFRVAAHLGRDKVAIQDIVEGIDVHSATADIIGVSRQEAKAHTFKPLYGGRSGTPDEVAYYEYFQERYAGITSTQQDWIERVLQDKCLRTEWGLTYYWPNTRAEYNGRGKRYVTNTTSICNYPVQAFATAEIIPIALVYAWHRLKRSDLEMFLVNTVHDSIIAELPESEVEAFHELCQQCFITDVYDYMQKVYKIGLVVPLGCGVATDSHWGSKDETSYSAPEELWKPAYDAAFETA